MCAVAALVVGDTALFTRLIPARQASTSVRDNDMGLPDVLGLLPAAGRGERLATLPCSKELAPVGFDADGDLIRPRVVCQSLLEGFQQAGVSDVFVVLGHGKWDIPACLGSGRQLDLNIAYCVIRDSPGTPHSLDQAYAFVRERRIAFGFPDIIFEPADAFTQLLAKQSECGADVVLGVFPAEQPETADMVDMTPDGRVNLIAVKSPATALRYAWAVAVWAPSFTEFMHEFLAASEDTSRRGGELFVGNVLQAAIDAGMSVMAVPFPEGRFIDVGTPENLRKAVRMYTPSAPATAPLRPGKLPR